MTAVEELLEAGRNREALVHALAVSRGDERLAWAEPLLSAIWDIHFGEDGDGRRSADTESGANDLTVSSLQMVSRLRPHARGTLGTWELTLVRSVFSDFAV